MPYKHTGKTGPFRQLLWSEDPKKASSQERKKRERAYEERNRRRDEEAPQDRPEGPPSDYAKKSPDLSQDQIPSRIQSWLPTDDPLYLSVVVAVVILFCNALAGWGWAVANEKSEAQLRLEDMESQLATLKIAWCLGTSRQIRAPYDKQMWEIKSRYRDLTGYYPDSNDLTCEKLGAQEMPVDAR